MPDTVEGMYVQLVLFDVADRAAGELLVAGVVAQVEAWVRHLPGFVSSTFHLGWDGTRVLNYARWRAHADWQAFAADPRQSTLREAIAAAGGHGTGAGGSFVVLRNVTPSAAKAS